MSKAAPEFELSIDSGSRGALGPLSVEVFSREGDAIADFALSSARPAHSFKARPGQYTIIARRPNGERLRRSVTIEGEPETVSLDEKVGESPNEFLEAETLRGEVRLDPSTALGAIALAAAGPVFSPMLGGMIGGVGSIALKQAVVLGRKGIRKVRNSSDRVAVWGDADAVEIIQFSPPSSFFKLNVLNPARVKAIGLLDDGGKGPIVIVPPFRQGVEISFICESLVGGAKNRGDTPSAVRAPVAVVLPREAPVADLLSAIASPDLDHADELWQDSIHSLLHAPKNVATDMLLRKFEYPAEALLAAHFLLRFMPQELPLSWADNLMDAFPEAADGPVIAAWARLSPGEGRASSRDGERCNREFQDRIETALDRPRVLYARTRRLLQDALRLLPALQEQLSSTTAPGEYLDHGAHAGGLEAFWGRGPLTAGLARRAPTGEPPTIIGRIARDGPHFIFLQTLQPQPA